MPIKVNDHCMDGIRYLVMGFWKKLKPYLPAREYEDTVEKNPLDREDEDDEYI